MALSACSMGRSAEVCSSLCSESSETVATNFMAAWCFPRQILQMPVFIKYEINSLLHQIFSLSGIPTGNRVHHSWKQIKVRIPSVAGFQGLRDEAFYLLQPGQQHSIYSWFPLTFAGRHPSLSWHYDFHGVDADILSRRWTWCLTYPGVLDKLWSRGRFHQTTPWMQELVLSQKRHFCGIQRFVEDEHLHL